MEDTDTCHIHVCHESEERACLIFVLDWFDWDLLICIVMYDNRISDLAHNNFCL